VYAAKGAAGSVGLSRTMSADHELRDGDRVIARGPRSEVMRAAAKAPHGATLARVGEEPTFMWSEGAAGWVFLST